MQLQLISFVLIIWHCMDYSGCQQHSSSRHRQHKREYGSSCQQGGCLTCSDYNGCLSCRPRFFMHLERIGMKQIGVCMTSCPPGFYGTRSPERNTCTSKHCRLECDSCFNKNFCTRCRAGFYLHLGKCQENCPEGLVRMHCEVGEWSEWSPCSRPGRTCGFKRGQETRTRQVLQYPSPFGKPCPEISEIRECLVKRRKCPGKENITATLILLSPNFSMCEILIQGPSDLSVLSKRGHTIHCRLLTLAAADPSYSLPTLYL
uniref:R-spondin 3 n=1 Tax=Scophthalmus maximus TaxID=52904 RepID=A0A8D3A042_SCOMX